MCHPETMSKDLAIVIKILRLTQNDSFADTLVTFLEPNIIDRTLSESAENESRSFDRVAGITFIAETFQKNAKFSFDEIPFFECKKFDFLMNH